MSILRGKKILIVDDELGPRESIRIIVRQAGAIPQTAQNGFEALNLLQTHSFDLIATCLKMPRMSGIDLCKEIKERGITTPILVISGYRTLPVIDELKKLGILYFITKPFDVDDIINGVGKALMDKTQSLICYINNLADFKIAKPEISAPYNHMGMTITDAILQAGTTWETVVKPRIKNLLKFPEAKTTSGFLELIEREGIKKLLNWNDDEKPNRILKVIVFFIKEEIQTEEDLKKWLEKDGNIERLKKLRGIGNKTADYFRILSGIQTSAIDRHLIKFLNDARIKLKNADYFDAREIINKTAEKMEISKSTLDYSIWKYMSAKKGECSKSKKWGTNKGIDCRATSSERDTGKKINPHQDKVDLIHNFDETWNYLNAKGEISLQTSRGKEFIATSTLTGDNHKVIKFFQNQKEYARAYSCCWGHYYNCHCTRFGMYAKALDEYLDNRRRI